MEVVQVQVRDQRGVDAIGNRGRGHHPAQVADPPNQQGVGDEPYAVQVDHRAGVPEPGEAVRAVSHPRSGAGPCSIARHSARMAWTASAPETGSRAVGNRRGT